MQTITFVSPRRQLFAEVWPILTKLLRQGLTILDCWSRIPHALQSISWFMVDLDNSRSYAALQKGFLLLLAQLLTEVLCTDDELAISKPRPNRNTAIGTQRKLVCPSIHTAQGQPYYLYLNPDSTLLLSPYGIEGCRIPCLALGHCLLLRHWSWRGIRTAIEAVFVTGHCLPQSHVTSLASSLCSREYEPSWLPPWAKVERKMYTALYCSRGGFDMSRHCALSFLTDMIASRVGLSCLGAECI